MKNKYALVSVYHKEGLEQIIPTLVDKGYILLSTGGTYQFINNITSQVEKVEDITQFEEILDGRVKTLHPKIFGGILADRLKESHLSTLSTENIPLIDIVVVDLYPFEEALKNQVSHSEQIEKIDIGGVSLLRAAAKNYDSITVISSKEQYEELNTILNSDDDDFKLSKRKKLAAEAFLKTSHYDLLISNFLGERIKTLRYGENPHQKAYFIGDLSKTFHQIKGKELSYNNLNDVDAAISLLQEFSLPTCVVIKHTNPCGVASQPDINTAFQLAYASDPISAFGGVIAINRACTVEIANTLKDVFFEVLIAPSFSKESIDIFSAKKNTILLELTENVAPKEGILSKSILNGTLAQDANSLVYIEEEFKQVSGEALSEEEKEELIFANTIVKHAKSNAIVLTKNRQLIGIGVGQTSRIDALKQSIQKAKEFGFSTKGAALSSDAFFPFSDSVALANENGITMIIQPGGSIKDSESIDYCIQHNIKMVLTGIRHFKH